MSIKRHVRTILLFFVLQIGVMTGVTMRPEDIERLLHKTRTAKAEDTLHDENNERSQRPGED